MPRVIGMRSPLRLRVEAKMKSDHAHRNANSETVTTELRLIGRMIERKIRQVPAPSIVAAWTISRGMPAMKAVKRSTPKGTAIVESAMMSPHTVLSRRSEERRVGEESRAGCRMYAQRGRISMARRVKAE